MRSSNRTIPLLAGLLLFACVDTSKAQSGTAEAKRIHAAVLTLDTHKDIPDALAASPAEDASEAEKLEFRRRHDPSFDGDAQVDFPKMRKGGYDCGFYIVYVGQGPLTGGGFVNARRRAGIKFAAIERMAKKFPDQIEIALTPDDVRRIHAKGKLVACIGMENGYPVGEDIGSIAKFYARGARYLGLSHTGPSQLADAHDNEDEPLHNGLSELGRKAIREMNRVGMMVDISHSSRAAMMQAVALSTAPVIASHSGCKALCPHTRNLDDEQLRALKKNGGVIQCVALDGFVKDRSARDVAESALRKELGLPEGRREMFRLQEEGGGTPELKKKLAQYSERRAAILKRFPRANVSDFVDHIDHAVRLIGIDHVGISSDFDGGGGIDGWNNAAETFNVTAELVRRGYTEAQIGQLWSGNLLRVWAQVQKHAAATAGK